MPGDGGMFQRRLGMLMSMAWAGSETTLSDQRVAEQWGVCLHSMRLAENYYFEDLESQTKKTGRYTYYEIENKYRFFKQK